MEKHLAGGIALGALPIKAWGAAVSAGPALCVAS